MPGLRDGLRLLHLLTVGLFFVANVALAQNLISARHTIVEADVARKLSIDGIAVNASQIHLATRITSAKLSPELEIVSAEPLGSNQVRLELRCATASECLPFLATLEVRDAVADSAEIRSKMGSSTLVHEPMPMGEGALQLRLTVGSHAVLIIREGHLEIHLRVLAIDTGKIGQQVRVCTLDRKKVFEATVTGEEVVTGVVE